MRTVRPRVVTTRVARPSAPPADGIAPARKGVSIIGITNVPIALA
jgi:hypothetical protein